VRQIEHGPKPPMKKKPYRNSWRFRFFKMRVAVNVFLFRFTEKGREQRRQAIAHQREQEAIQKQRGIVIRYSGNMGGQRRRY